MTSDAATLTPFESKRRAAAVTKADKLVMRLGFRRIIAHQGFWYHPDLGQGKGFPLTVAHAPVESIGEVLCQVFDHGASHGRAHVQNLVRQAAGF